MDLSRKIKKTSFIDNPLFMYMCGFLTFPIALKLPRLLSSIHSFFLSLKKFSFSKYITSKGYVLLFTFDNPLGPTVLELICQKGMNVIIIGSSYTKISIICSEMKKKYNVNFIIIDKNFENVNVLEEISDISKKIQNYDVGLMIFLKYLIIINIVILISLNMIRVILRKLYLLL